MRSQRMVDWMEGCEGIGGVDGVDGDDDEMVEEEGGGDRW